MKKPVLLLVMAASLTTILTAQAGKDGLYRWQDKDGTLQYSDIPPEGVKAEFIEMHGAVKVRGEDTAAEPAAAPNAGATDKADGGKVYKQMEVMPEKDPELCKKAQANLKALDAARIRITEPDGTQRILTEDEKETQRENARKFIKVHC